MWMLKKYFRFAGCFKKPDVWNKSTVFPVFLYHLDILYYLWSQHNCMKYLPRIQHHSLWCMTDDFHSFTYCAGIPLDFLLNISTWSILFYPANPCCRITMGEGLKIMILKQFEHVYRKTPKAKKERNTFFISWLFWHILSLYRPAETKTHHAALSLPHKMIERKHITQKTIGLEAWTQEASRK